MKWIQWPKIIPRMMDLLREEQKFREDRVNVVPIPGVSARTIDRNKIRPWHTVPNIKDFVIELRPMDWLTTLFGLRKRFPSRNTFYTWMNGELNVYIDYMFNRIDICVRKGLYQNASQAIWILMGSTAYQTASINHVMRNWHRKLTWKEVRNLAKQVDKLVKRQATDIDFSRTYIPKGQSWRPLGVPAPAWRVYLHMYNNCLVQWRLVTEKGNQHAYLPGRGVLTAWRDLTSLLKEPNIFEADYEGFFNNVKHAALEHVMYGKLKMPFHEVEFNMLLNQSLVKLQKFDRIEEKDRTYTLLKDGTPNPQARPNWYYRMEESTNRETIHIEYLPDRLYIEKSLQVKKEGVPQGAPTSCSLATLALRHLDNYKLLIYADDLIYFPKSSECDPYMDLHKAVWGLKISRDKSRWVKKDGIWQVPSLKFLGIRYFPGVKYDASSLLPGLILSLTLDTMIGLPLTTVVWLLFMWIVNLTETYERFEADTRNGAKLAFTGRESFLSWLAIARQLLLDSDYFTKGTMEMTLTEWLEENWAKWNKLKYPLRLLFAKPFKNRIIQAKLESVASEEELFDPKVRKERIKFVKSMLRDYVIGEERYPAIEKDLKNFIAKLLIPPTKEERESVAKRRKLLESKLWVSNPLTGYFVSRMQSNSWDVSVKQDFKLRYIPGSWIDICWGGYAWEYIIPISRINVFNASTFACHALADEIRAMKRGFPQVRRVSVTRHKGLSKHQLELLKILTMFRPNVG